MIRLRAEYPNHVWSFDFVHEQNHGGRAFKTSNVIDESTREYLMIRVKRKLNSLNVLTNLFILRRPPAFIRSVNGAEFADDRLLASSYAHLDAYSRYAG